MDYAFIDERASAVGLTVRGGFHPGPTDLVPELPSGPVASLVLLGGVGGSIWPHFSRSPELADGLDDPLDRWTRRIAGELAQRLGAGLALPFGGPPYLPFQRWARRAEGVHPSPLGILIHPRHGLWHAYRAALLFPQPVDLPEPGSEPSPCLACTAKPCLSACPVGAFSSEGYAVEACVTHIESPKGVLCLEEGCRARLACPIGPEARYGEAQMRFHMKFFLKARQRARAGA